jgi:hypothetical protein
MPTIVACLISTGTPPSTGRNPRARMRLLGGFPGLLALQISRSARKAQSLP